MATVHVVAMEIATLKGCRRSLCFIKWLQGMTKRTWASGMKDVRSGFDLFTAPHFLMETNCSEQGCCVFLPKSLSLSRTRPRLSLPLNAATLDKFMKKQMAATSFLQSACTQPLVENLEPYVTVKPRPFVCACQ